MFFLKTDIKFEKHRILFEDISKEGVTKQIQFTGYPFLVAGMKRMECSHGVDRDKERKLKRKLETSAVRCIIYFQRYFSLHATIGWLWIS